MPNYGSNSPQHPQSTYVWPSGYYPMHPDSDYLNQIGADNYLREREVDRIWRENPPTKVWHFAVLGFLFVVVVLPLLLGG